MPAKNRTRTPRTPRNTYGPVGALVFNSYWRTVNLVLAHNEDGTVTEQTIDHPLNSSQWTPEGTPDMFRVRTHRTPLDKRDRVIALSINHHALNPDA